MIGEIALMALEATTPIKVGEATVQKYLQDHRVAIPYGSRAGLLTDGKTLGGYAQAKVAKGTFLGLNYNGAVPEGSAFYLNNKLGTSIEGIGLNPNPTLTVYGIAPTGTLVQLGTRPLSSGLETELRAEEAFTAGDLVVRPIASVSASRDEGKTKLGVLGTLRAYWFKAFGNGFSECPYARINTAGNFAVGNSFGFPNGFTIDGGVTGKVAGAENLGLAGYIELRLDK